MLILRAFCNYSFTAVRINELIGGVSMLSVGHCSLSIRVFSFVDCNGGLRRISITTINNDKPFNNCLYSCVFMFFQQLCNTITNYTTASCNPDSYLLYYQFLNELIKVTWKQKCNGWSNIVLQ